LISLDNTEMFSLFYGLWKYIFSKTEFHVLILGIDKAGKTVMLLFASLVEFMLSFTNLSSLHLCIAARKFTYCQWFVCEFVDIAGEIEVSALELGRPPSWSNYSHCWTKYWSYWSGKFKTGVLGSRRSGMWSS
jgi:hypothetical protein